MEQDLTDILMAWTGEPIDDDRRRQLLSRLRDDAEFRKAFVAEIQMLGMLRAVQSAEPRWLELEDEIGWTARAPRQDDSHFEDGVMLRIDRATARRPSRWLAWGAGIAAVLAVGIGLGFFWFHGAGSGAGPIRADAAVAVVTQLENVRWGSGELASAEGALLAPRRIRLAQGHATIDLFNGVTLHVEGPADFEIASLDRVACYRGKIRARVPESAQGFAVTGPGVAVLDMGTEYAMNVTDDGTARIMVFKGRPQLSILDEQGDTLRSVPLKETQSVSIAPRSRRVELAMASARDFVPLPVPTPTPADLNNDYATYVRASKPWGYWRFEEAQEDSVPNEIEGRPAMLLRGGVEIETMGHNHSLLFPSPDPGQYALMDGFWDAPLGQGYAIEVWLLSENIDSATIAALVARPAPGAKDQDPHAMLVELTGRSRELIHQPGAMRYLLRLPPGAGGGTNAFTRKGYIPQRWYHVVAQRVGDRMEFWVNGEKSGEAKLGATEKTDAAVPCRLILGRLKITPQSEVGNIRPFVGRLDELAVYERPLAAEEIKEHYEAGRGMMQPKR